MSYDCPNCGSRQTTTFEMIHSQGTRSGYINASTVSLGGDAGFAGGQTYSQSLLANQLSPPQEPKIAGQTILASIIASFFASGLVVYLIASFIRKTGISVGANTIGLNLIFLYILLIPVLAALGCWLHKRALRKLMPGYFEKLREWSNGMICRRCGYTWVR